MAGHSLAYIFTSNHGKKILLHSSAKICFNFRRLMWKKEFDTSYVGFMKDGAQWLVDHTDFKLVGKDTHYAWIFCHITF